MRRNDILLRFALLIILAILIFLVNPNFGKPANLINILSRVLFYIYLP